MGGGDTPGAGGWRAFWAFLGLLVASLAFRFPALRNAAGVHSDSAIVGLQARHILRGEWSWFLWGDGQQSSLDALAVALGFLVGGETALMLMVVPLVGHLLLTWFVWDVLRKRVGLASATLASLAVVLGPAAVTLVALYAPRQWCFTALAGAFWLLDGASGSRWSRLRYGAGVGVALGASALDLIAGAFLPALLVFGGACVVDGWPGRRVILRRLAACGLGLAVGGFVAWLPRQAGASSSTWKAGASLRQLVPNARLLMDPALPWTLSAVVLVPGEEQKSLRRWEAPGAFRVVQVVGAGSLVLGVLLGAGALVLRGVPWEVRRVGLLGASIWAGILAAYLVSVMPVDAWSVRYLGPLAWSAPWALAPTAWALGARRLGLLMGPYLLAAAVNGWLSYGPAVRGGWPVRDPHGVGAPEEALGAELARLGVRHAQADYWLAYRLSFLLGERLIATPLAATDIRYAPYVREVDGSLLIAYLFHPNQPGALASSYERDLRASGVPLEHREVAGFTVLLMRTVGFHYEDDRGAGRLSLTDEGPGAESGSRRLRMVLRRESGETFEGEGLRRVLSEGRDPVDELEFVLGDGRVYRGRIFRRFSPHGVGTVASVGGTGASSGWRIVRMDRRGVGSGLKSGVGESR